MKKILSLIMLLLTICSGAWALQSYTWNLKTLQTTEILGTVNTIPTASYTATDANGSNTVDLIVQLANNKNDKINTDGVKFNGSSGTGTVAGVSNTNQRLIYFVAPCAGHVKVTGYTSSTTKNMYIGTSFNAKTAEDGMLDTKNNGSSSSPFTMEADIASGATCWIYSDGTAFTTNIVFEETAPKTKWDAPEISASGWDGTNWTITITGETGASLKYATKESAGDEYGDYADYSTTFTAVPGTYVKAYAYDATPTYSNSDDTEFVVPAKPTVSTPTLTLGSYDYTQNGYSITPYCEDADATLQYRVGTGGSYVACTSGTPFYLVGDGTTGESNRVVLRASKSGWENSAAYLNGLNVAPATSSPEILIPWQKSSASLEANTMHVYKSVSMAKANAQDIGQTNGNVWKLRTGTNSNTVTLSVNEGYKVSRVKLVGYSVNSTEGQTISLSKVSVDGADYNTSPGVTFPVTAATQTYGTYDSGEGNDMNATSSIVFTFNNSNITSGNQTQIWATEIQVWYEEVTDLTFDYSADGANAASWTKSPIAVTTNATAIDSGNKFIKSWPSNSDLTVTLTGTNALVTNVVLTYQDSNRLPTAITANDGTELSTSGATQTWTNNAGKNSVTFTLTGSPRLTKIVVTYVDAVAVSTLAGRNYGTCVTSQKMDFTNVTDAKAYIATGLNGAGTAVVLTQVYKVPANEPIIIYTTEKTEAATVYVPQTTDDPDAAVADNLLIAGDGTTAYDGYSGYDIYYVASDQFHKANAGTLQSGKAYLKVAQGTGGNSLTIAFDDEATAVEAVAEAKAENAAPVKVIKNGKLYIGNYNVAGQLVK